MAEDTDRSNDLKWYPRSWRDRYGDDFALYLQDRYGDGKIPIAARLSMIRSGSIERLRTGGIVGTSVDTDIRIRGASLLVLIAWGVFVIAGSAFAKYSEHWQLAMPRHDYWLPAAAMLAVRSAAVAGALILLVAGLLTLPAIVDLIRSDGWKPLWALARPMAVSVAVAAVASMVIVTWNHHLGQSPSATAPLALKVAGVVGGLLVVCTLAVSCATAVALVYRVHLSPRVTRTLGVLAIAMAAALVIIFAGARSPTSPAPAAMVVLGLMMLSGLVLAGIGAARITVTMSRSASTPTATFHR
jgi:hypothetical protein